MNEWTNQLAQGFKMKDTFLGLWTKFKNMFTNLREREGDIDVREKHCLPPIHTPAGDWTQTLGMCPPRFGVWDDVPTN